MTHAERVSAIAALGFTERQAAFLVLVMLHSGVCRGAPGTARSPASFAARRWPTSSRSSAAKRYATPYPCGHNKARVLPRPHTPSSMTRSASETCGSRKRSALARTIERANVRDGLIDQFLPGKYEPAAFALRLAHKDMTLATQFGRDFNVPMRIANLALAELSEALNRGWGDRELALADAVQQERAGVEIRVESGALGRSYRARSSGLGEPNQGGHRGFPASRSKYGFAPIKSSGD